MNKLNFEQETYQACKKVGGTQLRNWIYNHGKSFSQRISPCSCPLLARITNDDLNNSQFWSFTAGFDNSEQVLFHRPEDGDAKDDTYYKLGQKFRQLVLSGEFD